MTRVLHFFPAHEKKFEPQAKRFFSRPFLENEWRTFDKQSVKRQEPEVAGQGVRGFDWVIFHSAPFYATDLIQKWSKSSRVVVQFWGSDYASHLIPSDRLLKPHTHRAFWTLSNPKNWNLAALKHRWYMIKSVSRKQAYLEALSSCDALGLGCGEVEAQWFPTHLQHKRMDWFVNYSSGSESSWNDDPVDDASEDVLLGNSAFMSNNHLDVIDQIQSRDNFEGRVVMPLSYGPNHVAHRVMDAAKNAFGNRAVGLRKFLPPEAYYTALEGCRFVVMGHMRQQAFGNLKWAFDTCRTIYLWRDSDMFQFFSENGFHIRAIESIVKEGFVPLNENQISQNKAAFQRVMFNDFEEEMKAFFSPAGPR